MLPGGLTIRPATLLAATLGALVLSVLLACAPAYAVVQTVGGAKAGVQPREISRYFEGTRKWDGLGKNPPTENAEAANFNNLAGNPVLHSSVGSYVIYWDPQHYYHGDWKALIDGFVQNLGAASGRLDNVFAVDGQYYDASNQPASNHFGLRGTADDTNPYPGAGCTNPQPFEVGAPLVESASVCLTDTQVRVELETFMAQHSLPRGMGTIYYLLTPPGVAVCLDNGGASGHCSDFASTLPKIEENEAKKEEPAGYVSYKNSFCSYHNAIGSGDGNTILYALIPWTAGGDGNNKLRLKDKTHAYDCQDGGFEPSKEANGELQEKEREKEKTLLEIEEFNKKNAEEKRKQEEAEKLGLMKPHNQEPNQLGSTRSEDGGFDTGLADLIINQIAVEQQNTVTNPLLNAWQDSGGKEVTDECRNSFFKAQGSVTANPETLAGTLSNSQLNGKAYYLNNTFNVASQLVAGASVPCLGGSSGVSLAPRFTAPNPVNAGEIIGLDGNESDITLSVAKVFSEGVQKLTFPTFTWDFGDGSPVVTGYEPATATMNNGTAPCALPWLAPCAGSVFHYYKYGGTYNVTLTATDIGGNTAAVTHPITVVGPPPPAPPKETPAGSSPTSSPSSTGGSPGTTPGATPRLPAPVAAAAVVSRSLRRAVRKGLTVRYSVNEQVAGHFEVLLSRAIARRLGIGGPPALGLPPGTPPQILIGRASLITTAAGRSTVDIQFSKRTASRLARLHSVPLMLRLFVRNADRHSPATTTVLTTVTLSG
jgi:hypothetical protein